MNILDTLTEAIQGTFRIDAATQEKLLVSFAILLVLWLIRLLVLVVVHRRSDDVRIRYRWKKTSQYVMVTLAVVILGTIWIQGFRSLATYLGLLSAGLAIALKELVANFVGWAFILWRRPFEVGDRIQIGDTAGDVIDLRIFQFTLLEIGNWVDADQSTGTGHPRQQRPGLYPVAGQLQQGLPVHLERNRGAGHLRERLGEGEGDPGWNRIQARRGAEHRGGRETACRRRAVS